MARQEGRRCGSLFQGRDIALWLLSGSGSDPLFAPRPGRVGNRYPASAVQFEWKTAFPYMKRALYAAPGNKERIPVD